MTEISLLYSILSVVIANCAMILPLFIWVRTEARADTRHMDAKLEANRELVRAIHDEIKDFHIRLCDIEKSRGKDA
jgi:hypothetical protein